MINTGMTSAYLKNYYSTINSYNQKKNELEDLSALMKEADRVRSPRFRKNFMKELNDPTSDKIGTVESELKLSKSAGSLKYYAEGISNVSSLDLKDTEGMYKKVKSFVDSYNASVEAMSCSDSVDALRAGVNMTNTVKTFSGAFSRAGITIGTDSKMTLDEKAFKAADKSALSILFSSSYSPVSRVADKAADIEKAALNKARTKSLTDTLYGNKTQSSFNSLMLDLFA